MKRCKIILVMLLFAMSVYSANNDSIYALLGKFLISQKVLDVKGNHVDKFKDMIFLSEILTGNDDVNVEFGIYKFSSRYQEDGRSYIFVKNKDVYAVFESDQQILIIRYLMEEKRKGLLQFDDDVLEEYIYLISCELHKDLYIIESIGEIKYYHIVYKKYN
ncbi:hypothetical protein [Bacteroides sedimenti]|uniref:Uncharacterized protein n=1 Tax=Bacteroides sedimenti TaxID=2136147 RepID=A0ABN6Z3K5_9BACE